MSIQALKTPFSKKLALAVLLGVATVAVAVFLVLRPVPVSAPAEKEEVLTVPEGQAGKVGDLQVSAEALKLAAITVQPVVPRLVTEKIPVNGSVQAGGDHLVKVTPRTSGKVVKILAQTGDHVRPGQGLAILESLDLARAQAAYRQASARLDAARKNLERQRQLARLGQFGRPQVEEARNKTIEAEREVNEAERHLSEERSRLEEAQGERLGLVSKINQARTEAEVGRSRLARAEALLKEELISRQDFERVAVEAKKAAADLEVAEAALIQGEARIRGALARVESAEGGVKLAKRRAVIIAEGSNREERVFTGQYLTNREIVQAEAEVREAEVEVRGAADAVRLLGGKPGNGNSFSLVTPIEGRVQDRSLTLGETVDPEHAAFTVVNLDEVWVQLAIRPPDLAAVRVGDRVELSSEAAQGETFRGVIVSIGSVADETTRTVSARTTLSNSNHLLRPGAYVQGHVLTEVRRERVTVPVGALQEHTGRPTLYVALDRPGAFEVRHVKLGVEGPGWREVAEGIEPGERIAASGTFYLKSEALKDSLSDGCCAPGG